MTLIANGITGDLDWEDAQDVARMLVDTGRAVPGCLWVDSIVAAGKNDRVEGIF